MQKRTRTPKIVPVTLIAGAVIAASTFAAIQGGFRAPSVFLPAATGPQITVGEPRLASGSMPTENMASLRSLDASFANLAEFASPAVVDIKTTRSGRGMNGERRNTAMGSGSGFIYRADGYILTNDHVVDGADKVTVTLQDGREFEGKVTRAPEHDLAVVKIEAKDLPTLAFADSSKVRPGQFAMALGAPFGLEQSVTIGHVSALHRTEQAIENRVYADLIQTDTAINRGNSGGPLINVEGQVIGINTAIFSPSGTSAGIGFAIPSNQAVFIADILKREGKVTRAFLGIRPETLKEFRRKEMNLPGGAVVATVNSNTPASGAGLREGDVITKIGDRPILSSVDLRNAMLVYDPGQSVPVEFVRNGQTNRTTVKLEEAPKMEEAPQPNFQRGLPDSFQTPEGMDQFFRRFERDGNAIPREDRETPLAGRPRLGVSVSDPTEEARTRFNIAPGVQGAVVQTVDADSRAEKIGLQPGDVIIAIGDTKITNREQLVETIGKQREGSMTRIQFLRFSKQGSNTVRQEYTRSVEF